MVKHARKRQKTEKLGDSGMQPLGAQISVIDDANKDDEERRLESLLFGVPFAPSGTRNRGILAVSDEEEGEDDKSGIKGKELEHLLDTDLFYVDDGIGSTSNDIPELDIDLDEYAEASQSEEDVSSENDNEPDAGSPPSASLLDTTPQKTRKLPAWTDPDDTTLQVSLASDNRLRKLRDAPSEDAVGGREYERRLRRQYEKINPTPGWASSARKKLHPTKAKRRLSSSSESELEEEEDGGFPELLSSTNGLSGTSKSRVLTQGTLAIERLRDANLAAPSEGEIKMVKFHPSPQVPVLLTAGADRRIRLFNIDGHTNPHLHTLHIPSLPLTTAQFHPSGSSILLTGPRPFYYTYDLQSGVTQRSPRGLWGTTFNNSNPQAEDLSMEICAFNPTGEVLAVAGRRGYVHLVDWKSGAGQVVGSLKMNAGVKSLRWSRGGSGEGRELMSLSDNAEVYVWDVAERRCTKRWQDDGGFGSRMLEGDRTGKYLAIGSNNGLVNIYGSEGQSSLGADRPKPLKTIGNLNTSISTLQFNHDSQLLAMASKTKKDQMRMIHLPSLTAFSNWPTSSTPLGHVTSIDFSAGSEFVAMGNNRGRVLLYHLRNFSSQ